MSEGQLHVLVGIEGIEGQEEGQNHLRVVPESSVVPQINDVLSWEGLEIWGEIYIQSDWEVVQSSLFKSYSERDIVLLVFNRLAEMLLDVKVGAVRDIGDADEATEN